MRTFPGPAEFLVSTISSAPFCNAKTFQLARRDVARKIREHRSPRDPQILARMLQF
jgi:hypothetical protein